MKISVKGLLSKTSVYLLIILALGFSACEDDDSMGADDNLPSERSMIVLNEGQFLMGNASISVIDLETDGVNNNVFESRNNFSLGDVVQRLRFDEVDDEAYIVVNNSSKIEVVNPDDFSLIRTIQLEGMPNDVAIPPTSNNMLVTYGDNSNLQALNKTTGEHIVWLENDCPNTLEDPFICGNDQAVEMNGEIYVGNHITGALMRTNAVFASIGANDVAEISGIPGDMAFDKNGDLWVLTNDWTNSENNSLYRFENGALNSASLVASVGFSASNMRMNADGDVLYFTGGSVTRMGIDDAWESRTTVFENAEGTFYYNFGIDASEEFLYLSDPKGFVAPGEVVKVDIETGLEVNRYAVGFAPSKIYFR